MNPTVLIYGATGYTGNLVALHARVTGLSFEIGGRNASLVAVRAGLAGVTAVLNCAGPFAGTAHALMDACIASGVHYLDITAAYKVYALAEASSARAQDANVMLLPGVGWDVVPSDALRCTSPPKSTGRSACASRCRWPIRCRAVRPAAWLKSSACDFGASAVAEVTGIDGAVVRARIDTVNGYTYTPLAAVAALHLVLADQVRSGFQTPYPASGAGFAATIADTRIVDMVSPRRGDGNVRTRGNHPQPEETAMPAPSYVHGAHDTPLIGATIGAHLALIAARHPGNDALVVPHQNVRWTYAEFDERVTRLAAGLVRLGLAPGDRVGIWSPNCAEWVLTQFATARAGLIMVNINPAYRRTELEYALDKVGCTALILAPGFKSSDYLAMLSDVVPELRAARPGHLQSQRLPTLRHVIRLGAGPTPGMWDFDAVSQHADAADIALLAARTGDLQFDDPVNIQFTSGTTGAPKGATLTHHNILNNGFFIGEAMRLTERDRLCIPVPLYHCFGMVLGNLACVTHGATMVYPGEGFDPVAVMRTVQDERCTGLHGVPTMFIAILDHADFSRYDLGTLRTGIMAGSPCPAEVMQRVIARMHMAEVTIAYGMTETSPVSFQSSTTDPVALRVTTIGRVHPHLEVKIVDGDGHIVPRGAKGELLTRGYSVMLGYWGDDARTREVIDPARWMHTGDLATIDDAGFATIVGRSKDMVIRGGENIYPREVEEFLYKHPQVLDVQCVGVPDPKYGEELCACIVLRPGAQLVEADIRAFCDGQIAHYKIPRYVRFVEQFPMTVTGKVQKYLLREQAARELDLA